MREQSPFVFSVQHESRPEDQNIGRGVNDRRRGGNAKVCSAATNDRSIASRLRRRRYRSFLARIRSGSRRFAGQWISWPRTNGFSSSRGVTTRPGRPATLSTALPRASLTAPVLLGSPSEVEQCGPLARSPGRGLP